MKLRIFSWTVAFVASLPILFAVPALGQENHRPHFITESLAEYAAGYEKYHHRALDAKHADATKYHAYRVLTSGSSEAIIARSVSVDAAGHLHIVGEPGTVVRGKATPGPGEMHILLPITVTPPE
jgi:hypothetical protein